MGSISVKNFDKFNETGYLNNSTYLHYFRRLKLLSTAMFKWENLPNGISKRFIENNLFQYGQLAFFHDEQYGFMVTKCNISGELNIYDEPVKYYCFANNGFYRKVLAKDCVIIRNNIDSIPTQVLIYLFCLRLYDIDRTIDVNIKQQKTPTIIQCKESQRLTLKNLLMQYEGNEPFIYGNDKLDLGGISSIPINAPFVADKLTQIKHDKWTECLDMLGINNANTSKKERLNIDEVNSNNQLLQLQSDSLLMTREFARDEINEKWGLDIKVGLREEQEPEVKEGGEEIE